MNKFSINLVDPEPIKIDFLKPYSEDLVRQINIVLEYMGAVLESTGYNTYAAVDSSQYKLEQDHFTFSDIWGNYCIDARSNHTLILIAKALVDSGWFEEQ
jgi:hypothetical protein